MIITLVLQRGWEQSDSSPLSSSSPPTPLLGFKEIGSQLWAGMSRIVMFVVLGCTGIAMSQSLCQVLYDYGAVKSS